MKRNCTNCGHEEPHCQCLGMPSYGEHEPARPPESGSTASGGSGAQPWLVEPTRAGWWWWLDKRTGLIELVNVKNFGTPWNPHLCAYGDGWGGWTIPLMNEHKPGWWTGPVEPPEPPREEPRPNIQDQPTNPAE